MRDGHIHSPYCPHGSSDRFEQYIKKAINHVASDKIPYLLQITRNANAKYGDMLLKDYYNKDIK